MNSDIYIFGKLGSYYSQYPDDFINEIFMKMSEWETSVDTYISVHRKGELMYYGYVRKLGSDRYIGFCSVLNGVMVTDFNALFAVFDSMLDHLAVGGEILKYSDSGEIVANTQSLFFGKPVLNQVRALLKDGLSGLSADLKGLPPESYGISVSESKQFDLHMDDMPQIVSASWNYCYTFIANDSGTPAPDSYQGVLCRLHRERKELEVTNSDLADRVVKLERQKKQQSVVFVLSATVIICFFILLGVMQSLDETQSNLDNTQMKLNNTKTNFVNMKKKNEEMQSSFLSKISEKDREIISLQKQNEQMILDLANVNEKLQQVQSENQDLRNYKKRIQQTKKQTISQPTNYYGNPEYIREATVITDTPIRKEPAFNALALKEAKRGWTVKVVSNKTNGYYKVRHGNTVGYLPHVFLEFK